MKDKHPEEVQPKMTPVVAILLVVIAILLLVIGALLGLYLAGSKNRLLFPSFMNFGRMGEMMDDDDLFEKNANQVDEMVEEMGDVMDKMMEEDTSDSMIGSGVAADIAWEKSPVKVKNFDLFSQDAIKYNMTENVETYRIGQVSPFGSYAGATLYLMKGPCAEMCFQDPFYRLLELDGKVILLEKYSDEWEIGNLDPTKFTVESDFNIQELEPRNTLSVGELPITLYLDESQRILYDPSSNTKVAFASSKVGELLTTKNVSNENETIYDKNGFYARAADGTLLIYFMKPPFWPEDNIPRITFNDGTINDTRYAYTDQGGCGATNYSFVVDPKKVTLNDLVKAGTAKNGFYTIYELKNADHEFLKDYYENRYYIFPDEEKISYQEFIKRHPLLYFYDELNRLIQLESQEFVAAAECGKPVIYLYPETPQNVHVEVAPVGGFTYTDPEYGRGWDVLAQPNGRLTELSSGQDYPYLFWEGDGGLYEAPDKGFVVEVAQVHTFLQDSLSRLGLNKQEREDFVEFWLPRMQGSPYYFISFYGNDAMDALAPLSVTPEPDTIIRILMDFQPLDTPVDVEGYELRAPAREGFTVVEWGGVIRE